MASANARPTLRSSRSFTVSRQMAVASSCVAGSGLFVGITRLLTESKSSAVNGHASQNAACANAAFALDVEPGQGHRERVAVPAEFVHRHLERRRWRLAAHARHAYAIGRDLFQFDRVEPRRHVRSEVLGTTDLVEQLRRDRADRHRSAGVVVLADHARSVGGDLGPRESEPRPPADVDHALDLLEERVVASRDLRADTR